MKWSSDDIFYQGTIEKKLPIGLNITYKLDGKNIDINDLIGKSGNVTIELEYVNYDVHTKLINGNNKNLYTPFTVTMGTIINNGTNINVTNGKVINGGNKNIIVGISAPGLYESLKLNELKGMDKITITYDTDCFELSSIYSVATSKLLSNDDLKIFDKLDSIYSSMNTLKESIDKIESGSKELLNGSNELANGSTLIYENLNNVLEKIGELEKGNIGVNDGLKQIIDNLKYSQTSFDTNKLLEIENLIINNTNTINKLSLANASLKTNYDLYDLSHKQESELTGDLLTLKKTYESNQGLIVLLNYNNNALNTSLTTINNINTQINDLVGYLETIQGYTNTITDGTTKLKNGVSLLTSKTLELNNGMNTLNNGIITLNTGINQFNVDGITKLNTIINTSLKDTEATINALVKLGNEYNYSMGSNGSSKIVLVVDSIKKEEKKQTNTVITEKVSFWTKIKNLFKK